MPPPNWTVFIIILIFEYILLVLIFSIFGERLTPLLGVSVVAMVLLALVCSYLAFHSFNLFLYFIPIFLIGWVKEIYETMREHHKETLDEAFKRIKQLISSRAQRKGKETGKSSSPALYGPENINNASRTFILSNTFGALKPEWQRRIINDLKNTKQNFPAKFCCFKRKDGSTWYGGCELQGGVCSYIGEGCPERKSNRARSGF